MSLDIANIKGLLDIIAGTAQHHPHLSEISTAAMDELKKIHADLFVERKKRGEEEAANAAKVEAERVAKAKAEEEKAAPLAEKRAEPTLVPEPEQASIVDRRDA